MHNINHLSFSSCFCLAISLRCFSISADCWALFFCSSHSFLSSMILWRAKSLKWSRSWWWIIILLISELIDVISHLGSVVSLSDPGSQVPDLLLVPVGADDGDALVQHTHHGHQLSPHLQYSTVQTCQLNSKLLQTQNSVSVGVFVWSSPAQRVHNILSITCSLGMLWMVGPSGSSVLWASLRSVPKWTDPVLWSIRT